MLLKKLPKKFKFVPKKFKKGADVFQPSLKACKRHQ